MASNIEIDPITGAPVIKNKVDPTPSNPIMPVVAQPTASPGLAAKPATPKELADKVRAILNTSSLTAESPKPFVVTASADATVVDDSRHISHVYPGIKQALREGGGDTQQQAQTFEKIKELLEDWSDN